MAHVFQGEPDARQAGDITPSRFRPLYRALTAEQKALHDEIKAKAAEMEALYRRACDLQRPPPVQLPGAGLDGAGFTELQCAEIDPFGADAWGYFAKGIDALELSVMWTVKGLTA